MAERSEAKKREAKLRVKIYQFFPLTRSFASRFFASLRSAIFSKIYLDNLLVILPGRVRDPLKIVKYQFLQENNEEMLLKHN